MLSFVNYTPRTHPEHKNKEHCRVHSDPANIPHDVSQKTPVAEPKSSVPRSAAPSAPTTQA
ncbi:unnamed protein product [Fusarium graminearum]|uniref:Uncharacterized protein n=2 Tax=Gibberella zeae TaxID=5518 RepID=I1S4J0_GIBZE|nr:hypothetical protein FGSG_11757 [Fusarium graminearum PH-1]EYB30810.1 hypothetical protein FG05_11757 [Fusarium graminearum]ESU05540.1 hypothetical protein FGSG_11757 [Fusarium graminearum PH-1]CAF3554868.1 unnamed protein product [Fusarium graminearum]CAF3576356.1 unnamed protein product [Fusarium graminearum]CAG1986469.1 unnamed protein product [Fusarium graminearum]|eukprot:XP_011316025.1 hypothetical protein FGSG_11757 [Fusarium graminearum PH-1]